MIRLLMLSAVALFAPTTEEYPPELVALEKQSLMVANFGAQMSAAFPGVDMASIKERIETANRTDDITRKLRLFSEAAASLEGGGWNELDRLRYSLGMRVERRVLDGPEKLTLGFVRLFAVEGRPSGSLSIQVAMDGNSELGALARRFGRRRQEVKPPRTLLELEDVELTDAGTLPELTVEIPADAVDDFALIVTVGDAEGNRGQLASAVRIHLRSGVRDQIAGLGQRVAALKQPSQDPDWGKALATAQYPVDLLRSIDDGRISLREANLEVEIAAATKLLHQLELGQNPYELPGLARRVHRLEVTGEVLPYMLFVPESYDPEQEAPLVVALHGLGARENSYFSYGGGLLRKEAEERGYLVVAPLGHRVDGWYFSVSELDVFAVLEQVMEEFTIDPDRVYLTGHSMGGFGSFALAARHPERFAAIAPVAGGGDPASVASFAKVPMFVVHGDADQVVPVANSRNMVAAARAAKADIEYIEIEGGDHIEIVAATLTRMFDFFDSH